MDPQDHDWREKRRREREEWRRRREERRREREAFREERRRSREEHRDERKERVLHTRVSDRLAEDIRSVAEELRVPVSNLVRNVLEDVFSVVEVVSDNVGGLVEDVVEEADRAAERLTRRARRYAREYRSFEEQRRQEREEEGAVRDVSPPERARPEFPDVLGWQPLVLNASQACAACGRALERGDEAYLGLTRAGAGTTYLCQDCAP